MNPRHRRLLIPGLLVLLLVVVLVASLVDRARAVPRSDTGGVAEVVCTVTDPRIDEQSGLAVSAVHDGLAYVINDSGSAPEVHALDLATCAVVGTTVVEGVAWRDPEALALGGDGTLWIADTGDNAGVRDDAALYALPEPGPRSGRVAPTVHPVAFETGRADVEALLVDPVSGAMWVATKALFGGELLELPVPLPTGTVSTATATGVSMPALVTDAAVTPDGRHALVRTYLAMHLYELGEDVTKVGTTPLPAQPQGETIAVEPTGESFLVGSEGLDQPLYRLPLATPAPEEAAADAGSPPDPAPGGTDDTGTGDTGTGDTGTGDTGTGPAVRPVLLAALAGGVTAVVAGSLVVRARRRP